MTREQYIEEFQSTYQLVSAPVNKDEYKIIRFRHRTLGRDLILRSYPQPVAAYEILTAVACPHLPEVYDVITLDDGVIILEEYIDGVTVAQMAEGQQCTPRDVRRIGKAVCQALSVLHKHDIVHRDVKPENIMITADNRVVLLDFNAARVISFKSKDTAIMGTLGYASPEQFGLTSTDARADVYAVGVLLNVLSTGKHPSEQLASGRLGCIVRKCTHINPQDRYQSAKKLADSL